MNGKVKNEVTWKSLLYKYPLLGRKNIKKLLGVKQHKIDNDLSQEPYLRILLGLEKYQYSLSKPEKEIKSLLIKHWEFIINDIYQIDIQNLKDKDFQLLYELHPKKIQYDYTNYFKNVCCTTEDIELLTPFCDSAYFKKIGFDSKKTQKSIVCLALEKLLNIEGLEHWRFKQSKQSYSLEQAIAITLSCLFKTLDKDYVIENYREALIFLMDNDRTFNENSLYYFGASTGMFKSSTFDFKMVKKHIKEKLMYELGLHIEVSKIEDLKPAKFCEITGSISCENHHLLPKSIYPWLAYHKENNISISANIHRAIHSKDILPLEWKNEYKELCIAWIKHPQKSIFFPWLEKVASFIEKGGKYGAS